MSTPTPGDPKIVPGDELTAEWLESFAQMGYQGGVDVDASSGLEAIRSTHGTVIRARQPLEFWGKITGAPTGTAHPFTRQIESGSGTFANGARTGTAYETGGSTSTLTNKIVRIWWGGRSYWFEYC